MATSEQAQLAGPSSFRVPLAKGQEMMRALRGRVSGLCQPTYVLDLPGGHGKSPVRPNYFTLLPIEPGGPPRHLVEDCAGQRYVYLPAAEDAAS